MTEASLPPDAAPEVPAVPEKPIGTIVDPVTSSGLLKTPTAEELAKFPPPVAPAGAPAEAANPNAGVFPLASPEQMQRPQPTFIEEPKPVERAPRRFFDLPEKTRAEVKAGWERVHPGEVFPENSWVEPTIVSARDRLGEAKLAQHGTKPVHDRYDGETKPPKHNSRTEAEMAAGRAAVARREQDAHIVKAKVADANAERLEEGGAPKPDDMGYNAGRQ